MSPAERRTQTTRAMDGLRRLVRALGASNRESERTAGIDASALFVLRQIGGCPGLSLGELAERSHAHPSTVSEVVKRLVEGGLAVRRTASDDARRAEIDLTARGHSLLRAAPQSVQDALVDGFERLPAAQRRALIEGLEAWLASAHLESVPATMLFEPSVRKRSGRLLLPWRRSRA